MANEHGFTADDDSPSATGPNEHGFISDEDAAKKTAAEDTGFREESTGQKAVRKVGETIAAGGKVLDYGRSYGGPLADRLLELAYPGKKIYDEKSARDAQSIKGLGTYQSGAESLKRAGFEEGDHLSKYAKSPLSYTPFGFLDAIPSLQYANPGEETRIWQPVRGGALDPSKRDVEGFIYDALRDPLTYVSFGGVPALKKAEQVASAGKPVYKKLLETAGAILNPRTIAKFPSKVMNAAGEHMYESGLTPIIQAGEKKGKDIAPTFYKHGIRGSSQGIFNQSQAVAKDLGEKVGKILADVDAAGGTADLGKAFKPYLDFVDELVRDSRISPEQANKILEDNVGNYLKRKQKTPVSLASQWKTDVSTSLPEKTYEALNKPSLAQQLKKTLAGGLREEVENASTRTLGPGTGDKVKNLNGEWGDFLTVMKPEQRQAFKEANRKRWTSGDLLTGLTGLLGTGRLNPYYGVGAIAGKRLIEEFGTTRMKTVPGYYLMKMAENPLISPAFDTWSRRQLIKRTKQESEDAGSGGPP